MVRPMDAPDSVRSPRMPGVAVALLFFALGLATSGDVAPTADEFETINAGRRNLEIASAIFAGEPAPQWSFHELTGFYFLLDTGRALFAAALEAAGVADAVRAFHF